MRISPGDGCLSRGPPADLPQVTASRCGMPRGRCFVTPTRAVPRFVWIYGIGMLAFSCLTSLIALFLMNEHGVTESTIGYFFTYIGVLNILMRLVLLGPVVSRVGETRAMRLGAATLILGLLAFPAAQNLWQLLLVIPLVPMRHGAALSRHDLAHVSLFRPLGVGHHDGGRPDPTRGSPG